MKCAEGVFAFQAKLIFICVILMLLSFSYRTSADENDNNVDAIILELFPNSQMNHYQSVLGDNQNQYVFANIKLRGYDAFIPKTNSVEIRLSEELAVISFEIYMVKSEYFDQADITSYPRSLKSRKKLLQLLFFNPKNNQIVAKPSNFPIDSDNWICTGDICDAIKLISLNVIDGNNEKSVKLIYSKNMDTQYMQVFSLKNESDLFSSIPILISNPASLSGCDISIDYSEIIASSTEIAATKKTYCDSDCESLCQRYHISVGHEVIQNETLLKL